MTRIDEYINSLRNDFLQDKSYYFSTASKVEIRGKEENPFVHLEYDDDGKFTEWIFSPDCKNGKMIPVEKTGKGCLYVYGEKRIKRIFATTFYRKGKMNKISILKLFYIIQQEPKKFQRFMYDNFLDNYSKDKQRWPELYIKRP
tara:strand:+ start:39 stop:470 length:432 start_codon:yes stop_codon:yes gene_type:complete